MTIATCWLLNEVGANMQLPYKGRFVATKFDRGWDKLILLYFVEACVARYRQAGSRGLH